MPGKLHECDFIASEVKFPIFTFFIVVSPRLLGLSASGSVGRSCNVGAWLGFAVISIRPGHRVDSSSVLSLFLLVFPVNRLAKRKVPTAGSALSAICVVRHLLYN